MKTLTILSILCAFLSTQILWSQQIETDYLEAISLARNQQKGLIYLFVDKGMDSKNTKDFTTNFLDSEALKVLSSRYVVLEINCSSNTDIESSDALYCRRLTMVYNKERKFPAVLATDIKLQPEGELQTDFSIRAIKTYIDSLK